MTQRPYVATGVRVPKTGELIAAQLRRKIVRGELQEGDTLPAETELMEQFEVSRPTLREAFRILEADSLIEIRRGSRGARVTAPDITVAMRSMGAMLQFRGVTLADVYEARAVIEPAAAGLLARRRAEGELAALRAVVDELESSLPGVVDGTVALSVWTARVQHVDELVVDGAQNVTLAIGSRVLRDIVATHLAVALRESRAELQGRGSRSFVRTVKSCRRLVDLVASRDAAGAEAHWKLHMEAAGRALLNELGDRDVLDLFV